MNKAGFWGSGGWIDAVWVLVFGALLHHHDIEKATFLALTLPLLGARLAVIRGPKDGNNSGLLAFFIGIGYVLNHKWNF